MITLIEIAQVAHAANAALSQATGDDSHTTWDRLPPEVQEHFLRGVLLVWRTPGITAQDIHDFWMEEHIRLGWRLGPVKDRELKTHPSLIPFDQLDAIEQAKDRLFIAIVSALINDHQEAAE